MKNLITLASIIMLFMLSCSKNKSIVEEINKEAVLTKKIQDIIPKQYLDSLKKLGLEIYSDVNPPTLQGSYALKPLILDRSNIPTDVPGKKFLDGRVNFRDQTENFDIKLLGRAFLAYQDTSIVTAISGSGKNFTVYGKLKATNTGNSAIFAVILSATIEGTTLKNVKYGLINIDNSKGGEGKFIKEGQGRIVYDSDFVSESMTQADFEAAVKKEPGTIGIKKLPTE